MKLIEAIDELLKTLDLKKINENIEKFVLFIKKVESDKIEYFFCGEKNFISKNFFISSLNKILKEVNFKRKQYYCEQLKKALTSKKTTKYNDINLNRWQEYDDIYLDSLWIIKERDKSGSHKGDYWGNFIPQIPNQLFRRYTKKGEWILDPFLGSGTSLIESKKLERNAIGIELQEKVAELAEGRIKSQLGEGKTEIIIGNSKNEDIEKVLKKNKIEKVQFIILHPPYWDIIKFSENKEDLSNSFTLNEFLNNLGKVIDNTCKYLENKRFVAIVIGDKYQNGEWIPLGFYCMQEFQKRGFILKSTIIKNFEETKGKMNQRKLWEFRALSGGFYLFKHEYIFIFQKKF